jgi:ABC-type transporter Mla subunit MlaD
MNSQRSLIVGVFVLAGLVLLGVMIYWFGQMALYIRGGYMVHGHLPSAVGVREGKRVHMDGIDIGEVRDARTSQPQRPGVWCDMHVNPGVLIPSDADFVAQQSTIGDLYLDFQTVAKKTPEMLLKAAEQMNLKFRKDQFGLWHARAAEPLWPPPAWQFNIVGRPLWNTNLPPLYLPTDNTARIDGRIVAPSLLPEELVADVRKGLSTLKALEPMAVNIQKLTEPRTLKEAEAGQPRNLWTMIEQFELTARDLQAQLNTKDSRFNQLLADADLSAKKLQETLDKAQKTLDAADAAFKKIGGKTDALADNLSKTSDDARELVKKLDKAVEDATATMKTVNQTFDDLNKGQGPLGKLASSAGQTFENINKGQGTLGKLATNDELYRALTTLMENLKQVADNTDRLMTLWREKGLLAKEGK